MTSINAFLQVLQTGSQPNFADFLQILGPIFPLLYRMQETPQDEEWHAEGNVQIHTQMVLDQIYTLIETEAKHLKPSEKQALILSAILHDIGKTVTTKVRQINDQKRIVSPHHELVGCSYLAYRLVGLGLEYDTVDTVLSLILYHHVPKLLVVRNGSKQDYYRLARLANLELLYYLAKADMLGRRCHEQQGQVDLINLFRLYCEEYELWQKGNPYQEWRDFFAEELKSYPVDCQEYIYGSAIRDFEAHLISTPHEAIRRHYPFLDSFGQLVIMCGPSGSGKSEWVRQNLKDHEIISLDKLREELGKGRSDQTRNSQIVQQAKQQLKQLLAKRKKVVWDATNLRKDFRSILAQIGYDYHAFVTLVVFHFSLDEIYRGNQKRLYPVAQEVLDAQIDSLEWVERTEAHRVLFVHSR